LKVFWFFFSKKNALASLLRESKRKRFFLKKEAKTFVPWFRCNVAIDTTTDILRP